jgi:four helix bundle protein
MKDVKSFEDLIAWQKARLLTSAIYRMTREAAFARDFGLRGQIQRAAVSIMSNIAEGFERGSAADFHHFLVIAKSSCAELRSQLYVALDAEYIAQEDFSRLMSQASEVARIIGGLRVSVAKQKTGC